MVKGKVGPEGCSCPFPQCLAGQIEAKAEETAPIDVCVFVCCCCTFNARNMANVELFQLRADAVFIEVQLFCVNTQTQYSFMYPGSIDFLFNDERYTMWVCMGGRRLVGMLFLIGLLIFFLQLIRFNTAHSNSQQ